MEERTVLLLFHEGRIALRRRPARGLLAGLWEYPNEEGPIETALAAWDLAPEGLRFSGTGVHRFTHVEWRMTALTGTLAAPRLPEGWVWADRRDLAERYAVPSAFAPFRRCIEEGWG